jgi:hypothetical protein
MRICFQSNNKFVLLCNICITGGGTEQLLIHSTIMLYKPDQLLYITIYPWRKGQNV